MLQNTEKCNLQEILRLVFNLRESINSSPKGYCLMAERPLGGQLVNEIQRTEFSHIQESSYTNSL